MGGCLLARFCGLMVACEARVGSFEGNVPGADLELAYTNMPYAAWQDFLGNRPLTQTLLSHQRERCHTLTIEGPCLRDQQS